MSLPRRAPLRRVLVATDFSSCAERALRRALSLPLARGAGVTLLHVLPPGIPARARARADADAKRALEALAEHRAVTPEVRSGTPFVEILRRARELRAELIVLGRHGKRTIRDLFIGTTAERVIRKGRSETLVVSHRYEAPYRRPLIAVDLDEVARGTLEFALRVVDPEETKSVRVVHAYNVPFEGLLTPIFSAKERSAQRRTRRDAANAKLAALVAPYDEGPFRLKLAVRAGDARSVVLAEVARRAHDLLAVGSHGRSAAEHALVGSVAEWAIAAAPCDVLVTRP